MLQAMESKIQREMACIADLPKCVWENIGLVLCLRPVGFEVRCRHRGAYFEI